jgi:hypothetical protein
LSLLTLPFFAAAPASAACGDPPSIWFQPTTVEKGNSILVTGTGITTGKKIEYTFSNTSVYPPYHFRYTTKAANSNCVVNQEYIDTHLIKKGDYFVTARIISSFPDVSYQLANLSIVTPLNTIPLQTPVNCGQATHVWYGPSNVITYGTQIYIAGVVKPNTQVNYYFIATGSTASSPATVQVAAPSGSCVTPAAYLAGYLVQGTYDVYAGFVDEYGRYNYSLQGQLQVN